MSGPDPVADAAAELRDPDEFVPCPRHGTRCYPEFRDDLAKRVEVAIGLASGAIRENGPDGVKSARDRIMMMIEDHDAESQSQSRATATPRASDWGAGRCVRCGCGGAKPWDVCEQCAGELGVEEH